MAKSWTERLNAPAKAEIKPAPVAIAGMNKGEIMLVPTPQMIDAFIRAIPAGRSVDVKTMRKTLAQRHKAEVTCPIYTGYHLRTVSEAAGEALERGAPIEDVTPFWRVLDETSPTAKRLTFGMAVLKAQRAREGL